MNFNEAVKTITETAKESHLIKAGVDTGIEYTFKNEKIASEMLTLAYSVKMDISGSGSKSFIVWH